jgi:hypothetical protein
MADALAPQTADDLRRACVGWPQSVVRQAVATVVPEPDAALVAAWLVDAVPSSDAPPMSTEIIVAIWAQLNRQQH